VIGVPVYEFNRRPSGSYELRIPDIGTEFEALALERRRSELHGEIAIRTVLPGVRTIGGTLHHAAFNFSSTRARSDLARVLVDRSGDVDPDLDWLGYLEALCQRVLAAEREGEPAVLLSTVERPGPERYWIEPFLLRDHPTVFFGDGGDLKSYLVLWWAGQLARTVPVLYADFEFSAGDHRDRLERLFGADMPQHLLYVRCDRPLVHETDRLLRIVDREQIQYAVIDSIGFACDGPPEAAEVAIRAQQAVRRLRVGTALVAHVRQENGDQKPFGSAFWHNSARSTWYVKRSEEGASEQLVTIGLYNRKANTTRRHGPRAFEFTFDDDAWTTRVQPVDVADVDDLAAKMPLRHRIAALVATGAKTYAELAAATDAKVDTIERTIRRDKGKTFARMVGPDGITRHGLRVLTGNAA
jgi:hypothetical protein